MSAALNTLATRQFSFYMDEARRREEWQVRIYDREGEHIHCIEVYPPDRRITPILKLRDLQAGFFYEEFSTGVDTEGGIYQNTTAVDPLVTIGTRDGTGYMESYNAAGRMVAKIPFQVARAVQIALSGTQMVLTKSKVSAIRRELGGWLTGEWVDAQQLLRTRRIIPSRPDILEVDDVLYDSDDDEYDPAYEESVRRFSEALRAADAE